jgi:hypothetical protein
MIMADITSCINTNGANINSNSNKEEEEGL